MVIVERLDGVAECFHKDTVLGIARLVELDGDGDQQDDSRQAD